MAASEHHEHQATNHALDQVYQYISPGTNEGISFELARLTDDIFTTSYLGGGDISLFTAGGHRGTIKSQSSQAYVLDSNAGAPTALPFDLSVDLSTGKATLSWTPISGSPASASWNLDYLKTVNRPEGTNLLFTSDDSSDDAAYSLSLILI